jgi:acetyl esterase
VVRQRVFLGKWNVAAEEPYGFLSDEGIRRFMVETDAFYPPDAVVHTTDEQRAFYGKLCAHFSCPHPPGLQTNDTAVAGPAGPVPIRIYRPDIAASPPVLLYLHGGGFIVGDLDSHDCVCAELAEAAGVVVLAVAYRLAPEHPFPAAFDDCFAVLSGLDRLATRYGFDASRLVVAGDSAGGNLTAATCMRARDLAGLAVAGQVLIYPGLGGDMTKGSYIQHANAPGLPAEDIHYYHEAYVGPPESPHHQNKYALPLLETDYAGLPPAFLVAAEWDPLRDDAFEYAKRLRAAGVAAHVRHEPLLVHAFLRARHMSTPAAESFAAIAEAARSLACDGQLPRA